MKRMLIALLLTPMLALADTWIDPDTGIKWTYFVSSGHVTIGDGVYNGNRAVPEATTGDVKVPDVINGYPVTKIAQFAFDGCKNITSIVIPSNVVAVGTCAFRGCSALTRAQLSSRMTAISADMFIYCNSLMDVDIPMSITEIGALAFYGCSSLDDVVIPSNVKKIGYEAFAGTKLMNESNNGMVIVDGCLLKYKGVCPESVVIPDGVRLVCGAFASCETLVSVEIPNGVIRIDDQTFYGCANLVNVTLPPSLTEIGPMAFYQCVALNHLLIPNSVTSIEKQAFWNCICLETVSFPYGIQKIGSDAFAYCYKLGTVSLPSSVEMIGVRAFEGCEKLFDITIPESVHSIGLGAFDGCAFLRQVFAMEGDVERVKGLLKIIESDDFKPSRIPVYELPYGDENHPWRCGKGWSADVRAWMDGEDKLVVAGSGAFESPTGAEAAPWVDAMTVEISSGITAIGERVFAGCAAIESICIPNGVQSIGDYSFRDCANLRAIELPSSLTQIGYMAFDGCFNLKDVVWLDGLVDFGIDAVPQQLRHYDERGMLIVGGWFLDCKDKTLSSFDVTNEFVGIGRYALCDMPDLERVELPETVKYIGKGAFANDTYLDEVELPDSVEVIGEGAFENCSWMQTMTMGAGVRSVGDRAFAGCTKLAAAKFADGLGEVGDAAFSNCWRMMSVSLPVSVSNVAATAFKDCMSLTGVTVPTGCGRAGARPSQTGTMADWFAPVYRQIENVTVPEGTTEVCAEMFAGCEALKTVELPEGVTNIASGAFRDCSALETILLPESLEAIGDEAFAGCAALKAIVLPKNVAALGKRVFSGCAALADVTLSRALTAIPDGTFAGCDSLDSFVVPEAVAELGSQIVPSATTAIYYLGNAPTYAADVYAGANASLVSYVVDGTKGWDGRPTSRDIPQSWPTSNARAIRTWSPVKVDVTFVGNGGTFGNPVGESCVCEQIVDTSYSLPPHEPVRKGYRFAGYWTEANGGTRVTSGVSVKLTKAHSLYAHWAVGQSVTVRFNATGGTVEPEERVYVSETPFGELPVPVRTHCDFAGWFTEASGGTQVTAASEVPLADRELFAHWTAKQYAIRFHANDGTDATTDQPFIYGATVTLAKNGFVREGYTFAGWATSESDGSAVYADGATVKNLTAVADGVVTMYAVWKENMYTVRFNANGGEGTMANQVFLYDEEQTLTACAFSKTGYAFAGWAVGAPGGRALPDGANVKNLTATQGEVVNLYAKWTPISYPISYVLGGGQNGRGNPSTYTVENAVTLVDAVRDGFRFLGWTPSNMIAKGSMGSRTFTALWTKEPTVNAETGTMAIDGILAGRRYGALNEPGKQAGLAFVGWSTTGDVSGLVSSDDVIPEGGVELHPVWERVDRVAEFVETKVGANENATVTVRVKGGNLDRTSSVKVYLKYTGASSSDLDLGKTLVNDEPVNAKTFKFPVTLKWAAGEVGEKTVTFKLKQDSVAESPETFVLQLGEELGLALGEARTCTVTIGDASANPLKATVRNPTKTKGVAKYDVSVSSADEEAGVVSPGGSWYKGAKVTVKAKAKTGYAFSAWYDLATGKKLTTSANYTFTVSKARTLEARFSKRYYVRALADPADGATVTGGGWYAKNKTATLKAAAKSHFKFLGWYAAKADDPNVADETHKLSGSTTYKHVVSDDVTVFACYQSDPRLEVFKTSGGSVSGANKYAVGKTATLKAKVATGYAFLGWYDADGSLVSQATTYKYTMGAEDVVFTAQFKKESALETPVLDWNAATNFPVGVSYTAKPKVSGEAAVKIVSVSGLPKGLSYKSGKVSGVPTTVKTNTVSVKVALTTNSKKTWTLKQKLVVEALPAWARGTYVGGSEKMQATLTVGSTGKVSGKLSFADAVWTLLGTSYSKLDAEKKTATLSLTAKKGTTKKTVTVVVGEDELGGFAYSETSGFAFEARQSLWTSEALWKVCAAQLEGWSYVDPAGDLTVTFGANGKATAKLTVGKNTFSCSSVLCPTEIGEKAVSGKLYLFFAPNTTKKFKGAVRVVDIESAGI